MRRLVAMLAPLMLSGCIISASPQASKNPKFFEVTAVEVSPRLYDALEKHSYTNFGAYGNSLEAVILLVDLPSASVRKRNTAFLKEVVCEKDVLFVEDKKGGRAHPDLREKLFDEMNLLQETRKKISTVVQEGLFDDAVGKHAYSFQSFPCRVKGSGDDVLSYTAKEAYRGTLFGLEKIPPDKQPTFEEVFEKAVHYSGIAVARNYEHERKKNPNAMICQTINLSFILTENELEKLGEGCPPPIFYLNPAVNLRAILKQKKIPYIVVGPKNIVKEIYDSFENPDLK